MNKEKSYDYIMAGGGLSGLSLAFHMNKSRLRDKKILIIDRETKQSNDRTWCFWQTCQGTFETIVHRRWNKLAIYGKDAPGITKITPYQYKMIRGEDFYRFVLDILANNKNIEFLEADIEEINDLEDGAAVKADGITYKASCVFNSSLREETAAKSNTMLQHFKGFVIESEDEIFDTDVPVFMDLRVKQHDDIRFGYVIPLAKNKGLVEFTLFSPSLLSETEYDQLLKSYIRDKFNIQHYKILETEFGVIPMSDHPFSKAMGKHIINIGTAGGCTKPSTGYTFVFVQRQSKAIVQALLEGKSPSISRPFFKRRFNLYDSTLLYILLKNKYPGDKIFIRLFSKNKASKVLKFLEEKTSLMEEISIFTSLPFSIFLKASSRMFFRNIFR